MSIQSMTGFARSEGQSDNISWVWELKSVNGKGLDIRIKLPSSLDEIDKELRTKLGKRFKRGTLFVALSFEQDKGGKVFQVDKSVLDEMLSYFSLIQERVPNVAPPTIDGILALKGVIEMADRHQFSDVEKSTFIDEIIADFETALTRLVETRNQEGKQIKQVLDGQIADIKQLCVQSESIAALQPEKIKQRLNEKVFELLNSVPGLPEDRLAQEAAVLMIKADIREELDRIMAHVETAQAHLQDGGPVGRQLDFLCQEFNREANTLCSKSSDVNLTRIGLALKTRIEQFREQVQNIE